MDYEWIGKNHLENNPIKKKQKSKSTSRIDRFLTALQS